MHDVVKGFGWLQVGIGILLAAWGALSAGEGTVRALTIVYAGGTLIVTGCICWTLGAILERLTDIRDHLPRS